MTTTLRIEHAIIDFETWKQAFERDPIGRAQSGVRRYRICRPVDDPKYVMIELDFDDTASAQSFLSRLENVWSRVELSPGLSRDPHPEPVAPPRRARLAVEVEAQVY